MKRKWTVKDVELRRKKVLALTKQHTPNATIAKMLDVPITQVNDDKYWLRRQGRLAKTGYIYMPKKRAPKPKSKPMPYNIPEITVCLSHMLYAVLPFAAIIASIVYIIMKG